MIFVAELRLLLDRLRDDDQVEGNSIGNLMVERDSQYIGFVDLIRDYDLDRDRLEVDE